MQDYFKNNPSNDTSALTLITGFRVFFEYSAPDKNNNISLQLRVTAEHNKLPENVKPIHVAAVLAATVTGSMSEVLALTKNIKKNI